MAGKILAQPITGLDTPQNAAVKAVRPEVRLQGPILCRLNRQTL